MKRLFGALHRRTLMVGATLTFLAGGGLHAQSSDHSKEWPTYNHDSGGQRFSPLTEIKPENVARLKVAWVYHLKPAEPSISGARGGAGAGVRDGTRAAAGDTLDAPPPIAPGRGRGNAGFAPSQVTPLVVNGIMYLSSPYSRVVAVDPTTGQEIWNFPVPGGVPSSRGVEY